MLLAKCIGQVQRFSAWRAWANVALAASVVIVPLVLVAALILALTR